MQRKLEKLEKSYVAPATWLAAGVFAFLLVTSIATAAPRAQSAVECGVAADMAVVARSLAEEEVQRQKARAIMARIYDVDGSERASELMREILDAAYAKSEPSQAFAERLFTACMKSGGDMNEVLGRRL